MKILGIDFYNGNIQGVVHSLKAGGLLLVPAAPALVTIEEDSVYYDALKSADIVIPDSGYMALIWNLISKDKIRRISGLEFIIAFFADKDVRKDADIFLIHPRTKDAESTHNYLQSKGFDISEDRSYVAPMYEKDLVEDPSLIEIIEKVKPRYIIINIGGGVQEKLGAYLKRQLSYKPAIICTGAAIAFLTGEQVHIPIWADKLFFGWLFRCIHRPRLYIPRYAKAFRLILLILNHEKNVRVG
jgi:N-acetylglucosaminyldiphosphoundecaprenol N-acetyl-beta-D-mannosaminyltransferase